MTARLKEKYLSEIVPALREKGDYPNPMQVPRVVKVVVNMGTKAAMDKNSLAALVEDMAMITGQKGVVTKSRMSISNFHLREGMSVGIKTTLRGERMFEFLDRLINVALPRIRDFRGVSGKSFDGSGNYNMGLRDQVMFPEIDPDNVKVSHGMDIAVCTTAETNDEARKLLKLLGFPFAR